MAGDSPARGRRARERATRQAEGIGAARQRFGEQMDAKYEQYLGALATVFRRGMREDAFALAPPRRLAVALAGLIHALIRRWLREKNLNLLTEGDALVQVLLRGVRRSGGTGR